MLCAKSSILLGALLAVPVLATAQSANTDPLAIGLPDNAIRREHYLVIGPENTPLQNYLAGKRNAHQEYVVHLLVDGQAFSPDDGLNLDAIDWQQLREDLLSIYDQRLAKQSENPPPRAIIIHTYFVSGEGGAGNNNLNFVTWSLEGFARQSANYDTVIMTSTFSNAGNGLWHAVDGITVQDFSSADRSIDETPKENEYVQVYPVKTLLSRIKTNDADCVVVIKPKFSEEFSGELPRSVRTSMSVFITQLEFDRKRKIQFFLQTTQGGEQARDWFIQEGAREMQHLLGFDQSSITVGY